ncbi:MAG: GNAT family N-acetyltransferase [Proteobacteria bacterium]|nr:GNAT family N-acetyltransferase [Pseudomonadota bacterium]
MVDQFEIRPATSGDARLLFEWRNDESTRQMSKNRDIVRWEDHLEWLDRRLKMERSNLFVCEDQGIPVATFRIDGSNLSYTVAPQHRNRGIAKRMLSEVRSRFGCLRAEVYAENIASIKAARNAGMDVVIVDA